LETTFLTKYGLRHYVTASRAIGKTVFSIQGSESDKMIAHARNLIAEMYDGPATVRVS
jgi:hypothetical protein